MKSETLGNFESGADQKINRLSGLIAWMPRVLVPTFSLFVLSFALLYATSAIIEFVKPVPDDGDLAWRRAWSKGCTWAW